MDNDFKKKHVSFELKESYIFWPKDHKFLSPRDQSLLVTVCGTFSVLYQPLLN